MTVIRIQDVRIQDVNQNNLYDPEIDVVTGLQGETLSAPEKAKKLDSVLSTLKAPSWNGLALTRVSFFLESLHGAKSSAFLGKTLETHNCLTDAEAEAKILSIPFDRNEALQLSHQALQNAFKRDLLGAEKAARLGDPVQEVQDALEKIKKEARELDVNFHDRVAFDEGRADQILKTTFGNRINRLYAEARKAAKAGNIPTSRWKLREIHILVAGANSRWNSRLLYNQTWGDQILKQAFVLGIPREYKEAEALAGRGQTKKVRALLLLIQSHIREANQIFSLGIIYDKARADEIMADALLYGISDNFEIATRYAKRGKIIAVKQWLNTAKQYVQEYNQNYASTNGRKPLLFDQDRANAILQCTRGLSLCPSGK